VGEDGGVHDVAIRTDTIRLGQLLQLAGLADSGSDAKFLLAGGDVSVNGEPETRRGRQVRAGDVVTVGDVSVRVVDADTDPDTDAP
jgi:ribosome-associated protein